MQVICTLVSGRLLYDFLIQDTEHLVSGLAVDLQSPGTVMVAALNCWWPDGNVFRTTDGGKTWTTLWDWASYPTMNRYYSYNDSSAPWLGPDGTADSIVTQIGWMMEALAIDPFDSNHWLYGTGATIYGGHDLLKVCLPLTSDPSSYVISVGYDSQCHHQVFGRWY